MSVPKLVTFDFLKKKPGSLREWRNMYLSDLLNYQSSPDASIIDYYSSKISDVLVVPEEFLSAVENLYFDSSFVFNSWAPCLSLCSGLGPPIEFVFQYSCPYLDTVFGMPVLDVMYLYDCSSCTFGCSSLALCVFFPCSFVDWYKHCVLSALACSTQSTSSLSYVMDLFFPGRLTLNIFYVSFSSLSVYPYGYMYASYSKIAVLVPFFISNGVLVIEIS